MSEFNNTPANAVEFKAPPVGQAAKTTTTREEAHWKRVIGNQYEEAGKRQRREYELTRKQNGLTGEPSDFSYIGRLVERWMKESHPVISSYEVFNQNGPRPFPTTSTPEAANITESNKP